MKQLIICLCGLMLCQAAIAEKDVGKGCDEYCNKPLTQGKLETVLQNGKADEVLSFGKQDPILQKGKDGNFLIFGKQDHLLHKDLGNHHCYNQ